jgi:hypothetical protein
LAARDTRPSPIVVAADETSPARNTW